MRNQTEIILEIGKLRKVPSAGTFGSLAAAPAAASTQISARSAQMRLLLLINY